MFAVVRVPYAAFLANRTANPVECRGYYDTYAEAYRVASRLRGEWRVEKVA